DHAQGEDHQADVDRAQAGAPDVARLQERVRHDHPAESDQQQQARLRQEAQGAPHASGVVHFGEETYAQSASGGKSSTLPPSVHGRRVHWRAPLRRRRARGNHESPLQSSYASRRQHGADGAAPSIKARMEGAKYFAQSFAEQDGIVVLTADYSGTAGAA